MTIEEYRISLHEIEENYKASKKRLAFEYAISNNPYKIGDIIESSSDIICIERIKWSHGITYDLPAYCNYYGKQLTKQLKPKKRQYPTFYISQFNVRKKIN